MHLDAEVPNPLRFPRFLLISAGPSGCPFGCCRLVGGSRSAWLLNLDGQVTTLTLQPVLFGGYSKKIFKDSKKTIQLEVWARTSNEIFRFFGIFFGGSTCESFVGTSARAPILSRRPWPSPAAVRGVLAEVKSDQVNFWFKSLGCNGRSFLGVLELLLIPAPSNRWLLEASYLLLGTNN